MSPRFHFVFSVRLFTACLISQGVLSELNLTFSLIYLLSLVSFTLITHALSLSVCLIFVSLEYLDLRNYTPISVRMPPVSLVQWAYT